MTTTSSLEVAVVASSAIAGAGLIGAGEAPRAEELGAMPTFIDWLEDCPCLVGLFWIAFQMFLMLGFISSTWKKKDD